MTEKSITTKEIYTLVNEMRKELTNSITRLETKFDVLEAGRLSSLETKFADFKGQMQGRNAMISAIIAFIISLGFVLLNSYLK